jgi:RNA polymerase sigma-70 factor, ECF subfamily
MSVPRLRRSDPTIGVIEVAASDAELVARAGRHDRWACEALYRRHVADALRLAMFVLRRRADAEDAVQDAFVVALTKLDRLRDPAAFAGWLRQIVANEARGQLRRRRVRGWFGLDGGSDDAALEQLAAPGATAEQRMELALIDRALAGLPDAERIAWTLRYVEGWRLDEIAGALSVSLATAKRRLLAARTYLAARVDAPLRDLDAELGEQP